MIDERSTRQVQRIDAAATTLRAIADCLVDGAQPPAAFGEAIAALSQELATLSREVSHGSTAGAHPPISLR
jgi:hypothetical protein